MVVTGTATTTKNGKSRPVTATATPADGDHGTLTLWFMAGNRKMLILAGLPLCRATRGGGVGADGPDEPRHQPAGPAI